MESYAKASKVCTAQLKSVWLQLGLTVSEQQKELDRTASQAEDVWERAVQLAQEQQAAVQDQISQTLRDINSIREELGIDMPPKQVRLVKLSNQWSQSCIGASQALLKSCKNLQAPAGRTLQATLQEVTRDLDQWESQKELRSQEIHALEVTYLV